MKIEKNYEHDGDSNSNCIWSLRNNTERPKKTETCGYYKSYEELRLPRPLHYWDQLEYWEESRGSEKTCYSAFSCLPITDGSNSHEVSSKEKREDDEEKRGVLQKAVAV